MTKLFLEQLPVTGQKVLVRVDFNVPLGADGMIIDRTRIEAAIPTIRYLLSQGAAVILMSHLGRPSGVPNPEYSMKPVVAPLKALLDKDVKLSPDCIGRETKRMVNEMHPGDVLLLENLRFYRGEEHPEEDPDFAMTLSSFAQFYVNDAFGTAHRKHASTYTITKHFPGKAAAGYLLQKEIDFIGNALENPERPFYAVIGGAKISTKIGVLRSLIERVDGLLIGGAMAYTFMRAQGRKVGDSLCEEELVPLAEEILRLCQEKGIHLILPADVVAATEVSMIATYDTYPTTGDIPDGYEGVDIGPQTVDEFKSALSEAKTILWNGPLGVFEMKPFAHGTNAIAQAVASNPGTTIVGGGDLIAALNVSGLSSQITHVSTGGGATLEYIEHRTLPCIEALSDVETANVD